jgi:hypothetical protein
MANNLSPNTFPFLLTFLASPAAPAPEEVAFDTENRAFFGDRTSQIWTVPEYVADANVKSDVGWHFNDGTGDEVDNDCEIT